MKPKGLLFGVALSLCLNISAVFSKTPLDLTINDNYIKTATQGFIEDGIAMIPLRGIADALGATYVDWDNSKKAVNFGNNETEVWVYVGSEKAVVNNKTSIMQKPLVLINDTTYISARFIGTVLGADVTWNKNTHTVKMTKANHSVDKELIDTSYTKSDVEWLAKIVHAEAQGENNSGKIAVANVVLNRTKSEEFPNTIYDVIFDRQYGVQFTPVANGAIYNTPSIESYHAAKKALFGVNEAGKSLYFCNPAISTNFWIVNNRPFHMTIGNHDFYL